jgi:hypothetical protein
MTVGIEGRIGEAQILLKSLMGELREVDPQTPREQIIQDDVLLILAKVRNGIIERKPETILSSIELKEENPLRDTTVKTEAIEIETKVSPNNQNKIILATEKSCAHFWMIEAPNGPESKGICKHCGVTKEFFNAFPEFNPFKQKKINLDILEPETELEDFESSRQK